MSVELHREGQEIQTVGVALGETHQLGAQLAILNEVAGRTGVVTMDRFAQQPIRFFLDKRG